MSQQEQILQETRRSPVLMNAIIKKKIINDFVDVLNQIDNKPSDEIESNLQKIIRRIRPLIHKV